MKTLTLLAPVIALVAISPCYGQAINNGHAVVLHAARLLDIEAGRVLKPGEVLVRGQRIVEASSWSRTLKEHR